MSNRNYIGKIPMKRCRNYKEHVGVSHSPYRSIFSQEIWGGMSMASISVHEEYPKETSYDPDDKLPPVYKNIPVEICVAGRCITATLDDILDSRQQERQRIVEIIAEMDWECFEQEFIKKDIINKIKELD